MIKKALMVEDKNRAVEKASSFGSVRAGISYKTSSFSNLLELKVSGRE